MTDSDRATEALDELRKALDDFRTGVVRANTETLAALDGIRDVVKLLADTRAPRTILTWKGREFGRHSHQVLEVAQRLAAYASGTGAVLQADEVRYLTVWLTWRVGPEGWVPTAGSDGTVRDYAPQNAYDDTVRQLAQAALALVRHHEGSR